MALHFKKRKGSRYNFEKWKENVKCRVEGNIDRGKGGGEPIMERVRYSYKLIVFNQG